MKHALLLLCCIAAGCSQGRVQTTAVAGFEARPAPSHVVITDFAITGDQVRLDSGVGAEVRRDLGSQPASVAQRQIALRAQQALAETLAKRLAGYGLRVERQSSTMPLRPGSLLVQGQIASVNEGNRARRVMIGLGSGASSIDANAQLYYLTDPARPQFMTSFKASADSGRMPGAAETMGIGAAAQGSVAVSAGVSAGVHGAAEMRRTGEEALADKLADALAKQIGEFAVSQGWLPASAIH